MNMPRTIYILLNFDSRHWLFLSTPVVNGLEIDTCATFSFASRVPINTVKKIYSLMSFCFSCLVNSFDSSNQEEGLLSSSAEDQLVALLN